MKLKVLGAALLAFAATSAFAVTHVPATTAGISPTKEQRTTR
jgi:predicted aconitase